VPDSLNDQAGLKVGAEDLPAAVLETAAQPICVVDPEGRIRFVNRAAVAALGYDRAGELLGRHSYETIRHRHGEGTADSVADWPMLLPRATGETVASDVDWFVRRDGSMFPVSYVSAPIEMLEGRGVVVTFSDAGDRVGAERLRREQEAMLAAQLRVAALVAGGAASADVFDAIAREVGQVTGLPMVAVWHYEPDGATATVVGAWHERPHPFQSGTRWPLDGPTLVGQILKSGRPVRIDDYAEVRGTIAVAIRESGMRSAAGAPIMVDGDIWGAMVIASAAPEPAPDHIDDRLAEFTELVATAIANAESRAGLARLAEEQAALRRVATLVARGTSPDEVFAAVTEEIGLLLPVDSAGMARYEPNGALTFVASWGRLVESFPVGSRLSLGGKNIGTLVSETGGPVRIDEYADTSGPLSALVGEGGVRSSVGTPIVVEGRLWGAMGAGSSGEHPLPAETEARLTSFTDLLATAIANAESRADLSRLAKEQGALRRVATLVAEGAAPSEVFETVTREVGILCGADLARMERYESGDSVIGVAGWSRGEVPGLVVGTRFSLEGASIAALVNEASGPVRVDSFADAHGPIAHEARGLGIRSSVGCPIVVDGRLWGVIAASTMSATPFPADTESQIAEFTELVATAIATTEARKEVAVSRARIVAATDEERRRVVRDLHDGAQQRLVQTVMTLKLAHRALQHEEQELPALVTDALDHAEQAMDELRELAHGILPRVLTQGGLRAGVHALASRMPVPVENAVSVGRLPAAVEATAYFVVAEALTNVAKHARARRAEVTVWIEDGTLAVQVRDDGIGGALPEGSGLLGLADRLAVLDGQLRVESPADGGTVVAAVIPLPG
jgi:PAS domain S-box-containing protein